MIKIINEDTIKIGDFYVYSEDRYKYGRTYKIITKEDAKEIIGKIDKPWNEVYEFPNIKEKEGYLVNCCSHSNGETTDFFMRISNKIYICSYVDFKSGMLDVSICYDISNKEISEEVDDDIIEDFIFNYAKEHY